MTPCPICTAPQPGVDPRRTCKACRANGAPPSVRYPGEVDPIPIAWHGDVAPVDSSVLEADRARLAGQTAAIVERLRQGPATNAELAALSLKYTSRVSDARAAGHAIDCERREGGLTVYHLRGAA